jgi:hypothetical protein
VDAISHSEEATGHIAHISWGDHRFGRPLRLCEKPSRAKAQSAHSVAETMVNAQLINWFQAVEIKIRQIAFVLPTITPKKS